MNKNKQDELYKKYPGVFKQKDMDMTETCMCWGITCGDGWYDIIDEICKEILVLEDRMKCSIEACQVKEKLGDLRFYYDIKWKEGATDKDICSTIIDNTIEYNAARSRATCEGCGKYSSIRSSNGWLSTICDECRALNKERLND